MMGLIVDVYRAKGYPDCTGGGISAKADGLCIVNVSGPFKPSKDCPAVMLVRHKTMPDYAYLVPAYYDGKVWEPDQGWFTNGGNIASTSDSRLRDAYRQLTGQTMSAGVAIHDRLE